MADDETRRGGDRLGLDQEVVLTGPALPGPVVANGSIRVIKEAGRLKIRLDGFVGGVMEPVAELIISDRDARILADHIRTMCERDDA